MKTNKYPRGVLEITDNGGKTADRYSVVFMPQNIRGEVWYPLITMSRYPSHPQGVGCSSMHQHRPCRSPEEQAISYSALPVDCQRVVEAYLMP